MPNHPPWTFAFDPLVPLHLPRADAWIGFNCLATAQGLVRRRCGLVRRVVHWNVDFVPNRFGSGPLTKAYEWLDRSCCTQSDGRVELSSAARDGRLAAYHLDPLSCPAEIIPMGAWNQESPKAGLANLANPRIVFLGHLVERMGLPLLVGVLSRLRSLGKPVCADVVGGGPLLEDLKRWVAEQHLGDLVTIHGFVKDFDVVERILAGAAVAVAPYEVDHTSFSRFADPGKLKAYLSAGLPILLTDVPPNAGEMAQLGGASVVRPDESAFAAEIMALLSSPTEWRRRHRAALEYALRFDWETLFATALPRLGIAL
ncbi:MAG: glycosyltransferase [Actinomycetota bacterium]